MKRKAQLQLLLNPWVAIFIVVIVLAILFMPGCQKVEIPSSGTEGGGEKDFIEVWSKDIDGNIVRIEPKTVLSVIEGQKQRYDLLLKVNVQNTGNIPIENVHVISLSPIEWENSNYQETSKTVDLDIGKSADLTSDNWNVSGIEDGWMDSVELERGDVTFTATVEWDFYNSRGVKQTTSKTDGITLNILPDVCIEDNTPWGKCSITNVGKKCINGELVWLASECGCDTANGFEIDPNNPEQCYQPKCSNEDQTLKGNCVPNSPYFCNDQLDIVEDCRECPTCNIDYYGNASIGCSAETGKCEYENYVSSAIIDILWSASGTDYAKFRTTDLNYADGTVISVGTACDGGDLAKYNIVITPKFGASAPTNCAVNYGSPIFKIPGSINPIGDGNVWLYVNSDRYYLCENNADGQQYYYTYSDQLGSSHGAEGSISINSNYETLC